MPNRIIKESVCLSKGLSNTTIFAQDLYKRLITYADDYGRFNCDPTIILARLYAREMDWVSKEDIWDGIEELCSVGKVELYSVSDRRFEYDLLGYFPNWSEHQRVRESKTRLPEPTGFDKELNDWALRRAVPLDMKIAVATRDECKCQECGENLNPFGFDIKKLVKLRNGSLYFDHTILVKNGGRATMENLRLLCPTCNLKRPKNYTYEDILNYLKGGSEVFAETCGEDLQKESSCGNLWPNQSNPIQSESNPKPNPIVTEILGDVFQTFEKCGFQITDHDTKELTALSAEYSPEWVTEAIKRASDRGKRSLGYIRGILQRWKVAGAIDDTQKPDKTAVTEEQKKVAAEKRKQAEQEAEAIIEREREQMQERKPEGSANLSYDFLKKVPEG
jgi:DnaD/phage-associated family protein